MSFCDARFHFIDGVEPKIITWLAKIIEEFTEYFINGRGSIIISKTIDKPIV